MTNDNNWAVLVNTSAYWFNYRHSVNVLGIYQKIRQLGIPDSNIILMLADDIACNPRNVLPGRLHSAEMQAADNVERGDIKNVENLFTEDVEVDFRGDEVNVDTFLRLMTNRLPTNVPKSKRLNSNENSRILFFLTGHGGDGFLKFRNVEELSSHDLAEAFNQMWLQHRYKEVLFIVDTCQASSMYGKFFSPNLFGMSSSIIGESSYSYTLDGVIGVSLIDRYSFLIHEFLSEHFTSQSTLKDLMSVFDAEFLGSTPDYRSDLFPLAPEHIKLVDFFSAAPLLPHVIEDGTDAEFDFKFDPVEPSFEPSGTLAFFGPTSRNCTWSFHQPKIQPTLLESIFRIALLAALCLSAIYPGIKMKSRKQKSE